MEGDIYRARFNIDYQSAGKGEKNHREIEESFYGANEVIAYQHAMHRAEDIAKALLYGGKSEISVELSSLKIHEIGRHEVKVQFDTKLARITPSQLEKLSAKDE